MRRGAKGVCESWKVVRAFSSWEVSRLGGGGVVFEVVEVWLLFVVVLLGSSGIWTLILRMYSSSSSLLSSLCLLPFAECSGDNSFSGELIRRQRNKMRRSGGVAPWHCRKSVMGSRRWYEVPSGKVRVWSRKGRGSMLFNDG